MSSKDSIKSSSQRIHSHRSHDSDARFSPPAPPPPPVPPPPQPPPPPPSLPPPPPPPQQQQQSADHVDGSSDAASMTSATTATTAMTRTTASSLLSLEGPTLTHLPSVASSKRCSRLRQLSPAASAVSYISAVSPMDSKDPSPTYSRVMLHRLSRPIQEVEGIHPEEDSLSSFTASPTRVLSRPLEPRPPAMEAVDEAAAAAVGAVAPGTVGAWGPAVAAAAMSLPAVTAAAAAAAAAESVGSSPPGHVAAATHATASQGSFERRVMSTSVSLPVSNAEVLANFIPVLECVPPAAVAATTAGAATVITNAPAAPRTFSAPHLDVNAHNEAEMSHLQTPVAPAPTSILTGSASSSGAEGGGVVTGGGAITTEEYLSRRSSQEVCCRICQETEPPLHVWCECKGTIGMAHKACLEEWLARSGATRCELCGFEYHTRRERRHTSRLRSIRYWLRGNVMEQTALVADAVGAALCLAVGSGTAIVCGLGMASLRRGYRGGGANNAADASNDPDALFLQLMCVVASMVAVVWFVLAVRFHVRVWRRWWSTQYDIRVVPRSEESIQNSEARRVLRRSKDSPSLPVIVAPVAGGGLGGGLGGGGVGGGIPLRALSPLRPATPSRAPPTPTSRRASLRSRVVVPRRHGGDAGWWARFWRGLTGSAGVRPVVRRQGSDLRRERTRRLDEIADADLRAALSRWQARGRRLGLGFRRETTVSAGSSAGISRIGTAGSLRVASMRLPRPNMERININRMYSPARPRTQYFPVMDPMDAIWSRDGFASYPMLSMPSSFVHQYARRPRMPVPPSPPLPFGVPTASSPSGGVPSSAFPTPWTSPIVTPSGLSVPRSASTSTDRLWRL